MKKHYITRRILTMLLAVVLLFAALPNSVYAQSFQDDMQNPITAQSAPQSVQPAPALPPKELGGQEISIPAVPDEEFPLSQDEAATTRAGTGEFFYVNGIENGGNLRSTPNASNDSNIIICIENGQMVEKLSQTGNWLYVIYYITYSNHLTELFRGYMHNSVLLPDGQKIIMANSDTSDKLLNMRSYPNGPIIDTIPNNHCMLYDNSNPKSGNWQQVVYNGKTGYVYTPLTKKATVEVQLIWEGSSAFTLYYYDCEEGDILDVTNPLKRSFDNFLYVNTTENGVPVQAPAFEGVEIPKLIFGQE